MFMMLKMKAVKGHGWMLRWANCGMNDDSMSDVYECLCSHIDHESSWKMSWCLYAWFKVMSKAWC